MSAEPAVLGHLDHNVAVNWDTSHRYTPPPRHRRRIILRWIRDLDFRDVCDAGGAQGYLLDEIVRRHGVAGFGCDISDQVIAQNRQRMPHCQFETVDLTKSGWPGGRQFDLVISSEVIEHIDDWKAAVRNLVGMSRKYLLITVPGGTVRAVDRMLGHYRHFQGPELVAELEAAGCTILRQARWGFPVHSLYKRLTSGIAPEKMYASFLGGREYSLCQKLACHVLTAAYYVNDLFASGDQLLFLARTPGTPAERAHS